MPDYRDRVPDFGFATTGGPPIAIRHFRCEVGDGDEEVNALPSIVDAAKNACSLVHTLVFQFYLSVSAVVVHPVKRSIAFRRKPAISIGSRASAAVLRGYSEENCRGLLEALFVDFPPLIFGRGWVHLDLDDSFDENELLSRTASTPKSDRTARRKSRRTESSPIVRVEDDGGKPSTTTSSSVAPPPAPDDPEKEAMMRRIIALETAWAQLTQQLTAASPMVNLRIPSVFDTPPTFNRAPATPSVLPIFTPSADGASCGPPPPPPPPPPPMPKELLHKPVQLVIGKRVGLNGVTPGASDGRPNMAEVLRDLHKVQLKPVKKSPGGGPDKSLRQPNHNEIEAVLHRVLNKRYAAHADTPEDNTKENDSPSEIPSGEWDDDDENDQYSALSTPSKFGKSRTNNPPSSSSRPRKALKPLLEAEEDRNIPGCNSVPVAAFGKHMLRPAKPGLKNC